MESITAGIVSRILLPGARRARVMMGISSFVLFFSLAAGVLFVPCAAAAGAPRFSNPESVVFDALRGCYLVSNKGDGKIIAIFPGRGKRLFNADRRSCRGLHIVDGRLYAASNAGVAVMDLRSGKTLDVVKIPGRKFLNDLTDDGAGNLYVTDTGANCIWRIRLRDRAVSIFVRRGISHPNGILFDAKKKSFLVCSWESHPRIWAVRLADGAVKTLAKPSFAHLDGLAADAEGRIYVSSGSTGKVYRYDPAFRQPPEVISRGHEAPADIYINRKAGVLAIPNFGGNTVTFIPLGPRSGKEAVKNRKITVR